MGQNNIYVQFPVFSLKPCWLIGKYNNINLALHPLWVTLFHEFVWKLSVFAKLNLGVALWSCNKAQWNALQVLISLWPNEEAF